MSNYLPPPPPAGMYRHLLPTDWELDPIDATWMRGLVVSALEKQIKSMCWHISHDETGAVATGYVTVTLQHDANDIRAAWSDMLGLRSDNDGGYVGQTGGLVVRLPNAVDPDEQCVICGTVLDPRSTQHPPDPETYDRHTKCPTRG